MALNACRKDIFQLDVEQLPKYQIRSYTVALTTPESLLEMQNGKPHLRPTNLQYTF